MTWDPTCSDKHCDLQVGLRLSPLDVWTISWRSRRFLRIHMGAPIATWQHLERIEHYSLAASQHELLTRAYFFWTGAKKNSWNVRMTDLGFHHEAS